MEFKYTPKHLQPLVKPERLAEVEAHFRDTRKERQRIEETMAAEPEWLAEMARASAHRTDDPMPED